MHNVKSSSPALVAFVVHPKAPRGAAKPPTRGFNFRVQLASCGGWFLLLAPPAEPWLPRRACSLAALCQHLRMQRPRVPPLVSAAFPRPWSRGSPGLFVVGCSPVPLPPSGVAVLPVLCSIFMFFDWRVAVALAWWGSPASHCLPPF
jgi:hypothetical protein